MVGSRGMGVMVNGGDRGKPAMREDHLTRLVEVHADFSEIFEKPSQWAPK